MTEQEKKDQERRWVMSAQAAIPTFPQGAPRDSERPDFLVSGDGGEIGVEVTQYFRDDSSQELAEIRRHVARRVEQRLREMNATVECDVGLHWAPASSRIPEGWPALADAVARVVAEAVGANTGVDQLDLGWEDLPDRVREYITTISIFRLERGLGSHCHSSEGGWLGSGIEGIQAALDRKSPLADVYRRRVNEVHLLVVAAGHHLSSMVPELEEVRGHTFSGPFNRAFFFEVWDTRGMELRIDREPSSRAAPR